VVANTKQAFFRTRNSVSNSFFRMRILVLGDGNYSYSRALEQSLEFRQLHSSSPSLSYDLLSLTSFDSKESLFDKYPESKSILQLLERNSRIQIHFSIDATQSLNSLVVDEQLFDTVIFNFPHIGIENSQIHSSMIGHILHQVKGVMKEDGVFYLSLADDQPHNWKLYEFQISPTHCSSLL
jgi:hypothetical protein